MQVAWLGYDSLCPAGQVLPGMVFITILNRGRNIGRMTGLLFVISSVPEPDPEPEPDPLSGSVSGKL